MESENKIYNATLNYKMHAGLHPLYNNLKYDLYSLLWDDIKASLENNFEPLHSSLHSFNGIEKLLK